MKYVVTVLPRALRQLYESAAWWAEHRSPVQASRWLEGFEKAIASLEDNPERCGLARENDAFPFTLRQLPYGLGTKNTHRAVFEIRSNEVIVYAIRHLAQADLTTNDI